MKQVHADGYNDDQVIIIENNESGSKLSIEEREGLTTELRLKNHEFSSFTNKDDNLFEELSDITDDLVKSNIIHEEIKMIKVERLGYSFVKLHVLYRFHEEWTVYDIDTKRKKLFLGGIEIIYDYQRRFRR